MFEQASIQGKFFDDFAAGFSALLPEWKCREIFAGKGPRGGGKPKLTAWQWIMARVYHEVAQSGSFATHVKQVTGKDISDSALSQRAQSIGWQLLDGILPEVLRPLAIRERHEGAFYDGWRLVAFDGVRFNLRNTRSINAAAHKVACSKGGGQPAFAQLLGVVVVEIGLHQPLGAALGWQGEGEVSLARELLSKSVLPEDSLLLGDRLYGSPWLLWELRQSSAQWLLRVKSNLKAKVIERLADGSCLVDIPVIDPTTRRKLGSVRAREIRAEIRTTKAGKPLKIRLWTSLLDADKHPAAVLVELYASRWEEELFFRELKSHLHGRDNLLDAQTPETAAQEVLAMLLGASLIASQRDAVAQAAGVEVLQVSFARVHEQTVALCQVFEIGHDLINASQRAEWTRRVLDQLATTALIPKRKPRSCRRSLRQPVKNWPKTKSPTSKPLIKHISITNP